MVARRRRGVREAAMLVGSKGVVERGNKVYRTQGEATNEGEGGEREGACG